MELANKQILENMRQNQINRSKAPSPESQKIKILGGKVYKPLNLKEHEFMEHSRDSAEQIFRKSVLMKQMDKLKQAVSVRESFQNPMEQLQQETIVEYPRFITHPKTQSTVSPIAKVRHQGTGIDEDIINGYYKPPVPVTRPQTSTVRLPPGTKSRASRRTKIASFHTAGNTRPTPTPLNKHPYQPNLIGSKISSPKSRNDVSRFSRPAVKVNQS